MSLTANPLFGIVLTLLVVYVSMKLREWIQKQWFNYMLVSMILIVLLLVLFDIPYKDYALGGDIILKMLGPITVVLAVPLYQHHQELKRYLVPILIGVLSGSFASLISVYLIAKVFGLDSLLMHSLLVKSVTTPIAISATYMVDGIVGLSVLSVVITGAFGALIASYWFRILGITNPIAKGIGLGVSAHAIGTARAFEMGNIEGAMSALSIVLAGVSTIFWLYLFVRLL